MKVKLKPLETELVKEQEKVSQLQLTVQAEASESQALKRVQCSTYSCSVLSHRLQWVGSISYSISSL